MFIMFTKIMHYTKQLVDYYSQWAKNGDARAPKYRKIAGVGGVEEIRDRAFAALDVK